MALWDARDAIALTPPFSLYRLSIERIHLQSYDQNSASASRSLAALLNLVGTMKWSASYKSNLGTGKQLFPVGTAKQIWAGNATVSKAELAKAKGVAVATITAKDIKAMQIALKADFELAEKIGKSGRRCPRACSARLGGTLSFPNIPEIARKNHKFSIISKRPDETFGLGL